MCSFLLAKNRIHNYLILSFIIEINTQYNPINLVYHQNFTHSLVKTWTTLKLGFITTYINVWGL
jgi:hypothetical protein